MVALTERVRDAGMFLAWSFLGALIVAAFFIAAFFGDFGPIRFTDPGIAILFMPLFTAFILGMLLTRYELIVAVIAALFTTTLAVVLVVLFLVAPLMAGVVTEGASLQQFVLQRVALSAVLLFPLVLLGCVVGRAIGEKILPPEETRKRREELAVETRAWHEQLAKTGAKPPADEARKP